MKVLIYWIIMNMCIHEISKGYNLKHVLSLTSVSKFISLTAAAATKGLVVSGRAFLMFYSPRYTGITD